VLTDGRGVPVGVAVAGANVHDQKLVVETFQSLPVRRPPRRRRRQHLCADKGYDAQTIRQTAARRGYVVHIPRKGTEPPSPVRRRGRARRWVVERLHSWTNRARRLLTRWEKTAVNYVAFLHLQFAITAWRTAGVLG
jgi:transposase